MSRRLFLTVALLVLPTAALAGTTAPAMVPRALNPPTLDGRLDDWPATPLMAAADASAWNSPSVEYGGPEDISAEARLAWDNANLYVAIKMRDDKLVRVPSADQIDKFGDSLALGLTAEGAEEANEFAVTLLSSGSPRLFRVAPAAQAGEVRLVSCVIDPRADEGGGWRVVYELAIPWSELSGLRPIAGERAKLTVAASDDDGSGLEGFLEQSVAFELSNSTSPVSGVVPYRTTPRPPLAATFLAPESVRFDNRRFLVEGRETLLFGGSVDYTRLSRTQWADRLTHAKAVGMNVIGVSVPWSYHQPVSDKRDLAELRSFLEAVGQAGLWAEVNVGPFTDERRECGGLPAWYLRLDGAGRQRASDAWMAAVLGLLKELQAPSGGPVIAVTARAVPEAGGWTGAASLAHLMSDVRQSGLQTPVLTANAPSARDNSRQTLANLLDSIRFYQAPSFEEIGAALSDLLQEENGPAVISMPGAYGTAKEARHAAEAARVALASGATALFVADFAPGADGEARLRPGRAPTEGVVDPSDFPTAGYGEWRLLGNFLRLCGSHLARALPAEGILRSDDPDVKAAVRLTDTTGFIFLWSANGKRPHQVRLTYNEPGTTSVLPIPASGAIQMPAGGARILPVDLPVGRGVLRYSTSEVAGLHQLGDRWLLVLYGDPDTPGEISLRWPGKPLVVGDTVVRDWDRDWDPARKILTLDYYHKAQDQYLVVDDLQIAILSRARAAAAAQFGEEALLTLSSGAEVTDGELTAERVKATLCLPDGLSRVTAALPAAPTAVTVDGKPALFSYTTPERVLELSVVTESFEQERQPDSMWKKIGRGVVGGPPKLPQVFDRAQFQADREAPGTAWEPIGQLDRTPEAAGARLGDFARFRTRVDPGGRTTLALAGVTDPTLAYVNGALVTFGSDRPDREADVTSLLVPGENELLLLVHLLPRAAGLAGLRAPEKHLPVVVLKGEAGDLAPDKWEMSPGLAGEAVGWPAAKPAADTWPVLRFGPWREQGRRYEDVTGAGWYRLTFGLPKRDGWLLPYVLHVTVLGNAQLYLNGSRLATLLGSGTYSLPLPDSVLAHGDDNLLVAAVYDPAGTGGLSKVEVVSDDARRVRRRALEITF